MRTKCSAITINSDSPMTHSWVHSLSHVLRLPCVVYHFLVCARRSFMLLYRVQTFMHVALVRARLLVDCRDGACVSSTSQRDVSRSASSVGRCRSTVHRMRLGVYRDRIPRSHIERWTRRRAPSARPTVETAMPCSTWSTTTTTGRD